MEDLLLQQKKRNKSTEDIQFEQLPHECLSLIFSHLSTKEVVRTSVLSSRWRYLWAYTLFPRDLEFNASHVFVKTNSTSAVKMKRGRERKFQFVRSVDKFLQLLQTPEIDKFRVQYDLGARAALELDRWISFALDKGVKEIDINLKQIDHRIKDVRKYKFPLSILDKAKKADSLRSLYLGSCILRVYSEFDSLKALESLTLDAVEISQTQLERLIPKCQHLQRLRLMYINGIEGLEIDGSSIPLKYMNVQSCNQLTRVEINKAAELSTFEYSGTIFRFFFKNTPQLRNVSIAYKPDHVQDGDCCGLSDVCNNLPRLSHLETLILSTTANHFRRLTNPRIFSNLKKLVIIANASKRAYLEWVLYLLRSSPLLEKFEMHLTSSSSDESRRAAIPAEFFHEHLQEVTVTGVRGYDCEVNLVHVLISTCNCPLRLITIDPRQWVYHGDGGWNLLDPSETWARNKRQWFHDEFLKGVTLYTTKLVIL